MNVLIVEDEITTRVVLRRILSRELGCDVTECQNGLEALEALSSQAFDFAVLDIRMPVLDGVETLEAIRRSHELASLPVVMMTIERDEARVRRVVELGISDYLLKPLRPENVSSRLRALVAKISGARAGSLRPVGRPAEGPLRLLVADGDAAFRRTVCEALDGWEVVEAESGVAALKRAVEVKPAAVLIGDQLGLVGPDLLLRKLRGNEQLGRVRLYVVVAEPAAARALAGHDGLVERTSDRERLRSELSAVVRDVAAHAADDPLDAVAEAVAAALSQFFGMMLSLEVEPDPEALAPAGLPGARVRLAIADPPLGVEMLLRCEAETAKAVARVVLDIVPEQATDVDLRLAVAEVARVVAGRVKTALEADGRRLSCGPPVPIDGPVDATARRTLTFRTTKDRLRYGVDFVEAPDESTNEGVPALP
jgi:CheY-like chemotaxis protein